jgi:hypothetical protein
MFRIGQITVSTRVSATSVAVGDRVTDSIYVDGLAAGENATIELQLFDLTADPDGTGTPLVHQRIEDVGNGPRDGLAGFTVPHALDGHRLSYRHRVVNTTSGRSTAWAALNDDGETTVVGRIGVATSVSSPIARVGSTVTDAVHIEGLAAGEEATAHLQLFDLTVDPLGTGAPLHSWTEPRLRNGNNPGLGRFTVAPSADGHRLGYRERITTSTERSTPWSELGAPFETILVGVEPCVGTDITRPRAGQTVVDAVILNDLASGEVATVTLELHDLTVDQSGRSPIDRWSLPGLTNGTTMSGEYLIPWSAAGHRLSYRHQITATTAGRSTPWSELGVASETLSICP